MKITEVRHVLPPSGWTKINTDSAARGQPGKATCGGVFRMPRGFVKGSFAMPLGTRTAIFAELMGVIRAVELARVKN